MLSDSWPSLFVGGAGTRSGVHIDSSGTHFWMAVTVGVKRWRVFHRDDLSLLTPVCARDSTTVCLHVNSTACAF
jgi:hypothetical protein